MTRTQKRDIQASQQHNSELEQALQQANLLILALHTMIEVAEQELQVPIRKKVWHQTVLKLQENESARVSVDHLCRLFGVSRQAFYHRQHYA